MDADLPRYVALQQITIEPHLPQVVAECSKLGWVARIEGSSAIIVD